MPADDPRGVTLAVDEGLATITLGRPEAGNVLEESMLASLAQATKQVTAEPHVRAVLVRSEGNDFCFGGDVQRFAQGIDDLPTVLHSLATTFHGALGDLAALEVPVVAAVQGNAAGGGISLACTCDLVIAADSARFVFAYPRLGISPDGALSWLLARRVGIGRALDWALTNRPVPAKEALDAGLVSEVVLETDLAGYSHDVAARLAAGPTQALAATKRLIYDAWQATQAEQFVREADSMYRLGGTDDASTGIRSFLSRQPPRFSGT